MSSRSGAKCAPWLENQISAARQNLEEWPDWMKAASRLDGAKSGTRNIVSTVRESGGSVKGARKK